MESTKDKIDKLLGISDGQSIDDVLDGMSTDVDKFKEVTENLDTEIKGNLTDINNQIADGSILSLSDLDKSMKEVEDLISMSKHIFKHVYENIVSSELCDSELIGSCSKLLESIHINVQEFISLYRDKQRFIEKLLLIEINHKKKLELMDKKHSQTLEILKVKSEENVIDTNGSSNGGFTLEDVAKMLSKMSEKQLDSMLGIPSIDIPTDTQVNELKQQEKEENENKEIQ